MNLKVIKSKNGYKIISSSNRKHPALVEIAKLLKDYNKYNTIHLGIYNVTSAEFSLSKSVYSYISDKKERMNKRNFNKWKSGNRQIKVAPVDWNTDDDINKILEGV